MPSTWSGGEVRRVLPGTPADLAGIRPGDVILEVNGERIRDHLDFLFFTNEGACEMKMRSRRGSIRTIRFREGEEPGRGIEFARFVFDEVRTCRNHCVFCFVRQLPSGLRSSLYLRDDDYRLSMVWGNFITLTNLEESDWLRIETQRLSPLRVSVHSLNPDVRARLMGNPRAALINEDIEHLTAAGITVHAQVVLLRDWNDGTVLDETLEGLFRKWPYVRSCGVVPAVYTRWRTSRPSGLRDSGWSRRVLDQVSAFARTCFEEVGYPFVWAADEFYLMAGRSPPEAGWYRDFPQYENGIGLIADFRRNERIWARRRRPATDGDGRAGARTAKDGGQPFPEFLIVTGQMAWGEIRDLVRRRIDPEERKVRVVAVPNEFFGPEVQAAGLLTGQDIAATLLRMDREGKIRLLALKVVLIPEVCLKDGEGLFLDGFTVRGLEKTTGVKVIVLQTRASAILEFFEGERCSGDGSQDRGHSWKAERREVCSL